MLSMKSLRVAFATIGSAVLLLLGPGFAAATVQELDALPHGPTALEYAYELIGPAEDQTGRVPGKAYPIMSPADHTAHKLVVTSKRAINTAADADGTTYIRLALGGGMKFGASARGLGGEAAASSWQYGRDPMVPTTCDHDGDAETAEEPFATIENLTATGISATLSSGGAVGDDYVAYRITGNIPIEAAAYDHDSDAATSQPGCDRPAENIKIWVDVLNLLALPAEADKSFTATISLHSNADDAQSGANASRALYGEATIVKSVTGRDVEVRAEARPAVAHVGSTPEPFLWFDSAPAEAPKTRAVLGMAKAAIARNNLLNPEDGLTATSQDLIEDGSLTFTVEGNLSIGAFNMANTTADNKYDACVAARESSASAPAMGNVKPTEDDASVGLLTGADGSTGQNAGTYYLCVQTKVHGANTTPIPATSYTGTITEGFGGTRARDIATGVIGQIRRNGTTVKITYLTDSEKYNQRLIIVNDSANDATYQLGSLVTEEGVTATPMSAASGTVEANSQVVLRVEDVVRFSSADGRRHRAAATLSMNADVDDVQVATTQVNLDDGSTDTVVYAAIDAAIK